MQAPPQTIQDLPLLATIDAGGTTFKCGLIQEGRGVMARQRIPTTSPSETLGGCLEFFNNYASKGLKPIGLGIASFGPIDVDPTSPDFGMILDGPKLGWARTNMKSYFEKELSLPVAIDTDVNGALLAELNWGVAQNTQTAVYMTIGTGIGAGIFANGALLGKPSHPEFGHIRLKRHSADETFKGFCSFHGDCLEGLASAAAFTQRFGNPIDLPGNHIGWDIEAYYLAQACNVLSLSLRPEKIILGGGLMLAPHLIGKVRKHYSSLLGQYLEQSEEDVQNLIVPPALGDDAGLFGGAYLAKSLT